MVVVVVVVVLVVVVVVASRCSVVFVAGKYKDVLDGSIPFCLFPQHRIPLLIDWLIN